VVNVILQILDGDLFIWISDNRQATDEEIQRAITVVADRLTGAVSDPIIRNTQERRQLNAIAQYLRERHYTPLDAPARDNWQTMPPGTYALRMNISVIDAAGGSVNLPVDVIVQPKSAGSVPLLIEAKSAGDFTNTNKRRKEEAQKMSQLRNTYNDKIRYLLFLCGYFDSGYLGYEAAEGIDWVWEHRIEDLADFGI
jgi:hypothetical protein